MSKLLVGLGLAATTVSAVGSLGRLVSQWCRLIGNNRTWVLVRGCRAQPRYSTSETESLSNRWTGVELRAGDSFVAGACASGRKVEATPTSGVGQPLPKGDVRVTSVYPSNSDMLLRRRERRNGPVTDSALQQNWRLTMPPNRDLPARHWGQK